MLKYIQRIQELDTRVYRNMGDHSQLVIDVIQDASGDFIDDVTTADDIGAFSYVIDCFLEIFDPAREKDIAILNELNKILEEWQQELVSAN
jgi:hypothetical protein